MSSISRVAAGLVTLASIATFAGTVEATPILELTISGGTKTEVVSDALSPYGVVYSGTYATSTGNYTNLGIIANGDSSSLTLNGGSGTVTGTPQPITIKLTLTELNAEPGSKFRFSTSATSTLATNSTITFASYFDTTDALYGTEQLLGSVSRTGTGSYAYNPSTTEAWISAPFSITIIRTLTPIASAHPTFTSEIDLVDIPEPATLAFLALGAAGLAVARRRRWS